MYSASIVSSDFPSLKILGTASFQYSKIKSIELSSVETIGTVALGNCSVLATASFPNAVSIGNNAFQSCPLLATASFPNVTTLGIQAFSSTPSGLTKIDFPSIKSATSASSTTIWTVTLTNIKEVSFNGATGSLGLNGRVYTNRPSLISASFASVSSVPANIFQGNTSMTYVNLSGLVGSTALGGSTGNNNCFLNTPNVGFIQVPSYLSASNAGNPDGDLQYLTTAPKSWTINYI
jgi:hypothetical protein